MPPDLMVLGVLDRRDHTALTVRGEVDLAGEAVLDEVFGQRPRDVVVLELAGVTFIDVAGARALERVIERLRRSGRKVTIGGVDEPLRRRLELAGARGLLGSADGCCRRGPREAPEHPTAR